MPSLATLARRHALAATTRAEAAATALAADALALLDCLATDATP